MQDQLDNSAAQSPSARIFTRAKGGGMKPNHRLEPSYSTRRELSNERQFSFTGGRAERRGEGGSLLVEDVNPCR